MITRQYDCWLLAFQIGLLLERYREDLFVRLSRHYLEFDDSTHRQPYMIKFVGWHVRLGCWKGTTFLRILCYRSGTLNYRISLIQMMVYFDHYVDYLFFILLTFLITVLQANYYVQNKTLKSCQQQNADSWNKAVRSITRRIRFPALFQFSQSPFTSLNIHANYWT